MAKFSVAALMNDASKPERSEADRDRDIPLELIDPSPANFYSMDGIEDLAASIELVGLQDRLRLRQMPGGRYQIISGHRRYAAIKMLAADEPEQWRTIPCKIIRTEDDAQAELQLILANSSNRVMTDADKVSQAERLKALLLDLKKAGFKFRGRMRDFMADMLQTSQTQIQRYEGISANLSTEWRAEFDARRIGITLAYEISCKSPELQAEIHAYYLEHPGGDEKSLIRNFTFARKQETVYRGADYGSGKDHTSYFTPTPEVPESVPEVEQPHSAQQEPTQKQRPAPEPQPSTLVEEGMEHGLRSGAQVEAELKGQFVIHLVPAIFKQLSDGGIVTFEVFGTGQKKRMRLMEVHNG